MQNYILILLGILVLLLIGVIYFGWRKIMNLEIEASRNKYDIEAIRGLLSKILDGEEPPEKPTPVSKNMQNANQLGKMQGQQASQNIFQKLNPQRELDPFSSQFQNPFKDHFEKQFQNNLNSSEKKNREDLESDVETLESSEEEEVPNDEESSVSVESMGTSDEEGEDIEEESEEFDDGSDDSEDESEDDSDQDESEQEEPDDEDEAQKLIESELALDQDTVDEDIKNVEGLGLQKGDEPEDDKHDEVRGEETVDEEIKNIELAESKKNKKNTPNQPAKDYKVGTKLKSSNDGKIYEVTGNGNRKRWKLVE